MKLCKKYIIWRATYKLGGKNKRNERRNIRVTSIRNIKEGIILDIRTGHNVGDFKLDNQEIHDVMIFNKYTPSTIIRKLHSKYRG